MRPTLQYHLVIRYRTLLPPPTRVRSCPSEAWRRRPPGSPEKGSHDSDDLGYPKFMGTIVDVPSLERAVGGRSSMAMLKSIDHLDPHCATLLAHSPLSVLGHPDEQGLRARLVGGAPGALRPVGSAAGTVGLTVPGDPGLPGSRALLTLLPGRPETLRVNGRASAGGLIVEEAFLHCGKAVLRSGLWQTPTGPADVAEEFGEGPPGPAARAFLAAAPFVVIVSTDRDGAADASPKGDPAGFLVAAGSGTVAVPDRPGNQRMDTLYNVLERAEIALLALVPGDDRTLEISGTARLTDDPGLLGRMAVRGRSPKIAVLVDVRRWWLADSPALRAADPWNPARHVPEGRLPSPAKVWADHVRRGRTGGWAARGARALVSEKVLAPVVGLDYRRNLY